MKRKLSEILLKELEIEINSCTNPVLIEIEDVVSNKENTNGSSEYQIAS